MKCLLLLIAVFVVLNSPMQAQEGITDTVPEFLKEYSQDDSARIDALLRAERFYVNREFEKGLPLLKEALELSVGLGLDKFEAEALRRLASYYRRKGQYDQAIQHALDAKKISERIDNKLGLLLANSTLSSLYRDQGYLQEALEMNKENIEVVKDDTASGTKARYYFDLGNSYRAIENFEESEQAYKQALEISKASNFTAGISLLKLTLGQLYKVMEDYQKARSFLNQVLPIYVKADQKANVALIKYDLATINSLEGKHEASIPLYMDALSIYEAIGKLYFVKDINQKLFISYNITGELEKAKNANRVYNQLKDSLDSKERQALIAEMKTKYETEKVEAEKVLADQRAEVAEADSRKNYILFVAAAIIAGLIVIIALVHNSKQKQRKKAEMIALELKESQKRLALEKQYRDSELKALKAQMNPHFIFNVLNSIQEFIVLNEKDLASDYLATFAELIRSYLHYSNQGYITVSEEIDALEKYLQLESLRFEDKLKYQIKGDYKEMPDKKIPTMVIQPYVENAIKHGLFNKADKQELLLTIARDNAERIQVIIEDNGIGREKANEIKTKKRNTYTPFAMEATVNRLDLLNQKFNNKIGLEIIDLKDEEGSATGTRVILNIPILN